MALPVRAPVRLGVQGLTIEAAIDHLVDAAQGVVENQLELARLDVEQAVARALRSTVLIVIGVVLLGGALVALAMAAYAAMPDAYPPEQRLAVIAGVAIVLGVAFSIVGVRRMGKHGGD